MRAFAALLITALLLPGAVMAQADESGVTVKAALHDGFGRVVFNWGKPVGYDASIDGGKLLVRFDQPVTADLSFVAPQLDAYISSARVQDDGVTVELALKRPLKFRTYLLDDLVVVDVYDRKPTRRARLPAFPGAKPDSDDFASNARANFSRYGDWTNNSVPKKANLAGPRASAGDGVRVRTGEHPGYTRYVFDWKKKVPYAIQQADTEIRIGFQEPADLLFGRLPREQQRRIRLDESETKGVAAIIENPEKRRVRHFLSGTKVVVDLVKAGAPLSIAGMTAPKSPSTQATGGPATEAARSPVAPKPENTTDANESVASQGQAESTEADKTTPVAKPIVKAEQAQTPPQDSAGKSGLATETTTVAEAGQASGDDTPPVVAGSPSPAQPGSGDSASAAPSDWTPEAALAQAAGSSGVPGADDTAAETSVIASLPSTTSAASETANIETGGGSTPDTNLAALPRTDKDKKSADSDAAAGDTPGTGFSEDRLGVSVAASADGYDVRLTMAPGIGVAAFKRAGAYWIVLDRALEVDLSAFSAGSDNTPFVRAERVRHPRATALRLAGGSEFVPAVRLEGNDWVLALRKSGPERLRGLRVSAQPFADGGARAVVAGGDAGGVIRLLDPEVRDWLHVAPTSALGVGVIHDHEFVQMSVLSSLQGIVVVQQTDGLRVHNDKGDVTITVRDGGVLFADRPSLDAGTPLEFNQPSLLRPKEWRRDGQTFLEGKRELEKLAAASDGFALNQARLELARFYFARGFATEALAQLSLITADRKEIQQNPGFRLLRGAALVMANRFDNVEDDLYFSGLRGGAHLYLWRAAYQAELGQKENAVSSFRRGWPALVDYDPTIRYRLGLAAVEAAIDSERFGLAGEFLSRFGSEGVPEAIAERFSFLRGRLHVAEGDIETALSIWSGLAVGTDRKARAQAALSLVTVEYADGKIDADTAIERLEKLRYAWRGDQIEFDTLSLLGRVYLDQANYKRGLGVMRFAVGEFSDRLDTEALVNAMSATFRRLFVEGEASSLKATEAVALFQEFRELTPIGVEGDRALRELAGRLVSLDLLTQASELLEHQVRFRLDGPERALQGSELALIYLVDAKPEKAIEVLNISNFTGIDTDVEARRRYLRARALFELGKADEALTQINADDSAEARALRGDIYWRNENWTGLVTLYDEVLSDRRKADAAFDEAQARVVLKMAAALTLSGNTGGLKPLAERYGEDMDATRFKSPFRILTSDQPETGALASVSQALVGIDDFSAYLSSYREAFQSGTAAAAGTGDTS